MADISLVVPQEEERANPDFLLYDIDPSYFSGKLQMYFRYRGFNFRRLEPTGKDLFAHGKEHLGMDAQVPFVEDVRATTPASERWLRDTTPIIQHLEADAQLWPTVATGVIPLDPTQAFLALLVEDYADEELWRVGMYYRWAPAMDGRVMSTRFTYEWAKETPIPLTQLPGKPFAARLLELRQWFFSIYGEGINTPSKHQQVQDQYIELLDVLESILRKKPNSEPTYLMGARPTIADFGMAGPFFRHFSSDFTARKIMQQRAPNVYEWVARLWNARIREMPEMQLSLETLPYGWDLLLPLVARYLRYLQENAEAWKAGKDTFVFNECEVPVVPYRVWCRKKLQERFLGLDATNRAQVEEILLKHGCFQPLFPSESSRSAAKASFTDRLQRNSSFQSTFSRSDSQLQSCIVECPPEGGTEPPFCRVGADAAAKAPGLGYKWPAEPLVRRYLQQRIAPRAAAALLLLLYLARWGPRTRRFLWLSTVFWLGRLSA